MYVWYFREGLEVMALLGSSSLRTVHRCPRSAQCASSEDSRGPRAQRPPPEVRSERLRTRTVRRRYTAFVALRCQLQGAGWHDVPALPPRRPQLRELGIKGWRAFLASRLWWDVDRKPRTVAGNRSGRFPINVRA